MPETNFWFDKIGDCKNPKKAIEYLAGKQADQLKTLSAAANVANFPITGESPNRTISLGNHALLMMGITEDLQTALVSDQMAKVGGIDYVVTASSNSIRVWYVRRRAGSVTKTVAIIASWPDYWGSTMPPAVNGKNWQDLWADPKALEHKSPDQSISLSWLNQFGLPKASGKSADF
jgi:hypothetical protein